MWAPRVASPASFMIMKTMENYFRWRKRQVTFDKINTFNKFLLSLRPSKIAYATPDPFFFQFFRDTIRYLLDNHLVDVTSIILSEGVPLMKNTQISPNRTHSLHFGDDGSLHSHFVRNRWAKTQNLLGNMVKNDAENRRTFSFWNASSFLKRLMLHAQCLKIIQKCLIRQKTLISGLKIQIHFNWKLTFFFNKMRLSVWFSNTLTRA